MHVASESQSLIVGRTPIATDESSSAKKQPSKNQVPQLTEPINPTSGAELVIQAWRGGNGSLIWACAFIVDVLRAFEGDPKATDSFLDELVSGRILPQRERQLGVEGSPKLSKLRKIGAHRDLLLSEAVFPRLGDGYSVIAQFLTARDALSGTDDEKTAEVFSRIERLGGDFCRDTLIEITRDIKAEKKAARSDVPDSRGKRDRLIEEGKRFRLAVFTPSSQQLVIRPAILTP